ncbi:MAG: transcriptional regulator NrdR [Desulfobacterales bacterium]|nr:transcriptional regulator NrdR [Desulfobacterales bacterium]
MKCPFCRENNNKVIDSRLSRDGTAIRRRRECVSCKRRFTTYEYIEEIPLMIIKKDKRRELFSRDKVRAGLKKACEKREISMNAIEFFVEELERDLRESEEKEISSSIIGEKVMQKLHELDKVAYVRFASVYRDFKDVSDFATELKTLLNNR